MEVASGSNSARISDFLFCVRTEAWSRPLQQSEKLDDSKLSLPDHGMAGTMQAGGGTLVHCEGGMRGKFCSLMQIEPYARNNSKTRSTYIHSRVNGEFRMLQGSEANTSTSRGDSRTHCTTGRAQSRFCRTESGR